MALGAGKYKFLLSYDLDGETKTVELVEILEKEKQPTVYVTQTLPVYVDVEKGRAETVQWGKSTLWQWPLGFLGSGVLMAVSYLVYSLPQNN